MKFVYKDIRIPLDHTSWSQDEGDIFYDGGTSMVL